MNLKRPAGVPASTPIPLSPPKVIIQDGRNLPRKIKTEISESPPTKKMKEIKLATPTIQKLGPPLELNTLPVKGTVSAKSAKPKILNKDLDKLSKVVPPKILNINASQARNAMISEPIFKAKEDGNVEIITEVSTSRDQNDEKQDDPLKVAITVETNVFPCDKCERSFPLKQLLEIHYKNHIRDRDFECTKCCKAFFSKYDLGKHMSIHTGIKPFQCVVCQKSFSRSTLLYRHEKIHVDEPKYLCGHCDKSFLSNEELDRHSTIHLKNRPFTCNICGKNFAFKQGMERHLITHEKKQPHACEYCDLSFMTPSKLARHLTAHAGVRPYPCKLCPKSFLMSHHLTRHLRAHTGAAIEYKCVDCDLVFLGRDDLIYHSAIHATEDLLCPLCKVQFNDVESVTEHIKLHSNAVQSPCDYCDLIFVNTEQLEEHCREQHFEDHQGNDILIKIEKLSQDSSISDSPVSTTFVTSKTDENGDEYVIEEIGQMKAKRGRPQISKKGRAIIQKGRTIPSVDETVTKIENEEVLAEFELSHENHTFSSTKAFTKNKPQYYSDSETEHEYFDEQEEEVEENILPNNDDHGSQSETYQEEEQEFETLEQAVSEDEYYNEFEGFQVRDFGGETIVKVEIPDPIITQPTKRSLSKNIEPIPEASPPKVKKIVTTEKKTLKTNEKAPSVAPVAKSSPASQQGKITSFFKNNPAKIKTEANQVADVIRSLPKGVTIIKKESTAEIKKSIPTPEIVESVSPPVSNENKTVEVSQSLNQKTPPKAMQKEKSPVLKKPISDKPLSKPNQDKPSAKPSPPNKSVAKQSPKDKSQVKTPINNDTQKKPTKPQSTKEKVSPKSETKKSPISAQPSKEKALVVASEQRKSQVSSSQIQIDSSKSTTITQKKSTEVLSTMASTQKPPQQSDAIQKKSPQSLPTSSVAQKKPTDASTPGTPLQRKSSLGPKTSTPLQKKTTSEPKTSVEIKSTVTQPISSAPTKPTESQTPVKKQVDTPITRKTTNTNVAQKSTPVVRPQRSAASAASTQLPSADNASYCEMKIGDRMVKVQKLRMTKEQLDAMKKEGKIEMKGGTIIMKRSEAPKSMLANP